MRDEPHYKKLHSERLNDEIVASRTRMYDRTAPKRIEIYKKVRTFAWRRYEDHDLIDEMRADWLRRQRTVFCTISGSTARRGWAPFAVTIPRSRIGIMIRTQRSSSSSSG